MASAHFGLIPANGRGGRGDRGPHTLTPPTGRRVVEAGGEWQLLLGAGRCDVISAAQRRLTGLEARELQQRTQLTCAQTRHVTSPHRLVPSSHRLVTVSQNADTSKEQFNCRARPKSLLDLHVHVLLNGVAQEECAACAAHARYSPMSESSESV